MIHHTNFYPSLEVFKLNLVKIFKKKLVKAPSQSLVKIKICCETKKIVKVWSKFKNSFLSSEIKNSCSMIENKKYVTYVKFKIHPPFKIKFADSRKMIDDDIINTIERINILIKLHIYLARLRLAGMDMEMNKYMRMYNGNWKELKIMYQNVDCQ